MILLFLAGCIASGLNAFAGGGSLVSFPVLVGLQMPELRANATNAVALWPGSLSSALGFRKYWSDIKSDLKRLLLPTFIGSSLGAVLLVYTSAAVFRVVVPLLILGATLLMAFQKKLRTRRTGEARTVAPTPAAFLQLGISLYGGYFGAGMGILMLSLLGLIAEGDIHRHNAIKNILGLIINFTASLILLGKGLVEPLPAVALMAGSIVGGYLASHLSQKVPADKLRVVVIVYGFVMTGWFLFRLL